MAAKANAKARLKAGAEGGHTGAAAFDQAAADVRAERNRALSAIRNEGQAIGAGGQLISQLQGDIRRPAQATLGNIAMLGGAAAYADQSGREAHNRYLQEANAGLGQIRAEADRDLAQQLAMLNAQSAGSGGGGGGGGGGSLSDSELRSRIIGAVQQIREGKLAQSNSDFTNAIKKLTHPPDTFAAKSSPGRSAAAGYGGTMSPQAAANVTVNYKPWRPGNAALPRMLGTSDRLAPETRLFSVRDNTVHPRIAAQAKPIVENEKEKLKQVILEIRNAAYGPGLRNDAIAFAPMFGLDPGLVSGVIRPQDEAAWVNANKKLGLYKDPADVEKPVQTYSTRLASESEAAKALKFDDKRLASAMEHTYYDWTDDADLIKEFNAWAGTQLNDENVDIWALRRQFLEEHPEIREGARQTVYRSVRDAGKQWIDAGNNLESFITQVQNDPGLLAHKDSVELALQMLAPYYQAKMIQSTQKVPDYITGP